MGENHRGFDEPNRKQRQRRAKKARKAEQQAKAYFSVDDKNNIELL